MSFIVYLSCGYMRAIEVIIQYPPIRRPEHVLRAGVPYGFLSKQPSGYSIEAHGSGHIINIETAVMAAYLDVILDFFSFPGLNATEPNDEQAVMLRDGMEILVGVLGGVLSGVGEEKH